MKDIMPWHICQKSFIQVREKDPQKVESIIEMAEKRYQFLQSVCVTEENASFFVEGYYEIIKEFLVALLLQKGMRAKNHQCLISYFYLHYKDYEREAYLIAEMSYFRNRLDYYGEEIPYSFYQIHEKDFFSLLELFRVLLKKSI